MPRSPPLTNNELVNDGALVMQLENDEETYMFGSYAERSLEGDNVTAEIRTSSFRSFVGSYGVIRY